MSGRALGGRAPDVEQEKGRVAAAPVQRYWPGKAPEWYKPGEEVSDDEAPAEPGTSAPALAVVLKRAEDPRLRRLAQACSHLRLFHNLACSFASAYLRSCPFKEQHLLEKMFLCCFQ